MVARAMGRELRLCNPPEPRPKRCSLRIPAQPVVAAEHPGHVAVDHGRPETEGDAGDGTGRVAADSRDPAKLLHAAGHMTAVLLLDHPRPGQKPPRSRVVAKSLPGVEDLVVARLG